MATVATVSSLAKETKDPSTVGASRAYSNGRSGEDECNHGKPKSIGRIHALA